MQCTVGACDGPVIARGWCRRHYSNWQRTGDPIPRRMYRAPVMDRLRSKLVEDENGCLNFTGWTDAHGYGRFKVAGAMRKPHRVAFEELRGPIPDGLSVCHRCDNPSCCNVEHLFLGTVADNVADMNAKGRGDTSGLRAVTDLGERLRIRAARLRREVAEAAGFPGDWKRCPGCDHWQAPACFGSNAGRPDGLQTYCHECRHARHKKGSVT